MEGMDFGTDIESFEEAEKHITEDEEGSMACLDAVGMDEAELDGLLDDLKGNSVEAVFGDNTLMEKLHTLFIAADTCIAAATPACKEYA